MKDLILTIIHLMILKHFFLYCIVFWVHLQDVKGIFVIFYSHILSVVGSFGGDTTNSRSLFCICKNAVFMSFALICYFFLTIMNRTTHKASFEQVGESFKMSYFKVLANPFTRSLTFGICCTFVYFILQTHLSSRTFDFPLVSLYIHCLFSNDSIL